MHTIKQKYVPAQMKMSKLGLNYEHLPAVIEVDIMNIDIWQGMTDEAV